MLLQAILYRTDFYKTLSLWYLSTSRHELSDSINICCIFFRPLSFFPQGQHCTQWRTLIFLGPFTYCVSSACMSPVTLQSQCTVSKEVPLLWEVVLICWTKKCRRSMAAAHSPPLGHPSGCQPQAAECTQCLQEWGSKHREEREHRRQPWELSPGGGFPTLLWSPVPCRCLLPSLGTLSQSLLRGTSKGGYKTWALSYIKKIKFRNSLSVQLPPDSLSKLTLNVEWFRYEFCTPKLCASFLWSMCSLPSLIFFLLPVCTVLSACWTNALYAQCTKDKLFNQTAHRGDSLWQQHQVLIPRNYYFMIEARTNYFLWKKVCFLKCIKFI